MAGLTAVIGVLCGISGVMVAGVGGAREVATGHALVIFAAALLITAGLLQAGVEISDAIRRSGKD